MRSSDVVMREASLDWYRSSFCQAGECVEIAEADGMVIMRSSVHPDSGQIYLSRKEFGSFLASAKAGEYASF
jgi:Domain of unknown function (DUF397)